jgi:hypothetical protein
LGFSLKVPQAITHEKLLRDCREKVGAFLTAARLLARKLLCCALQCGYFNRKAFAGLGAFLERLRPFLAAWPADVPLGDSPSGRPAVGQSPKCDLFLLAFIPFSRRLSWAGPAAFG